MFKLTWLIIYFHFLNRRIASMGEMSKDEKERMHLYTKILEYEQDTVLSYGF